MKIKNIKIAAYGGSGFVGSNFIAKYPEESFAVPRDCNYADCDQVVYFISTNNNYNIFDNTKTDIKTNIEKLIDVLDEHRSRNFCGVFNFISSWFVYGMQENMPVKEDACCKPTGFYSITKYAAEMLLRSYCDTFGMKYRILRLCNIVGNDKGISAKKNAIQHMFRLIINNENVKVYDEGMPIRDIMHVDDACRAIRICVEKGDINDIYNISNSDARPIIDYISTAKNIACSSSKIEFIHAPEFHKKVQAKDMWLDNNKIINIGYIPEINSLQACERVVKEMMANEY